MKEIEKVCVVGAGAIGSLLVGHLGTVVDMAVLTRRKEHAKALNEEGLRVSGKSELHARRARIDGRSRSGRGRPGHNRFQGACR